MFWKKYAPQLLTCWILLSASLLKAQEEGFFFETLPPRSDIGQTAINAMLQDRQGYLWLGTWSGLWRYDAYTFRQFGYPSGLNSSKITCLFEETDGTLWVGTRNTGLYRFNRGREFFEPATQVFRSADTLRSQNITSIFRDREGRYWIGAEEGLSMFDPVQRRLFNIPLRSVTPPPSENIYLYSICQTPDGSLWVSGSHGLYHAANVPQSASEAPVFQQIALHPPGSSAREVEYHNFVYTGQAARHLPNALWIGTKQGLKLLDLSPSLAKGTEPTTQHIRYFEHRENDPASLSHNFAIHLCEGGFPNPDAVWVATFKGLNLLDPATGRFQHFFAKDDGTGSLLASNIRSLLFDRSGILWVGTSQGVNKLNPHFSDFKLHTLRHSRRSADEAISFLSKTERDIWVSSFGGGIFRVPMREGRPLWSAASHYVLSPNFQSPVTDFISAVLPDGKGNLWCITQGAGAFRFREQDVPPSGGVIAHAEQFTKGSGPLNTGDDYLMSGLASRDGRMWIGCWDGGLNLYDPARQRILKFNKTSDGKADFHPFPVVSLLEIEENGQTYLWAGTRGGGLFQLFFDEKTESLQLVRHIHREGSGSERMDGNFIASFLTDERQDFWIVTETGLFVRRNGRAEFEPFASKNFPQAPHYEAIVPTGGGQFWVSTQKGVGFFKMEGEREVLSVFYENRNGLRERAFNSNSFLTLPSGELLLGGSMGVTSFRPDQMQPDPNAPTPVITGLRLFNQPVLPNVPTERGFVLEKSLSVLPQLVLSHHDNVVSFEFSGLHFSCPEQNRFAYKLDGFDPAWIDADASQRLAHYTNLPPGDYRFLVKTANSDGVWNPQPAQLAVRVLPPWWRTSWAYTLYFAAFLGLLWLVRRITLIRANYENEIEVERIEKQKLEELNQMKLIFFTNISHELKTPLTLIISPLEEIIRSRTAGSSLLHNTLSMMHRNALRLLTMINQLLDIRKAEAGLMKLEVGEGNAVQFVSEVCLSFRELARQRQIQFSFQPEKPVIMAWFDPDQLEKVLFNLLSNAFKFTPPGGEVRVSMGESAAGRERFFVRFEDNGKGIAQDKLPFIFDRFFRAEEHAHTGDEGGSGIGLSLVKSIVERHRGAVEAESELGRGAVFTVWLPLGEGCFSEHEKRRPTVHGEEMTHYLMSENLPETLENEAPVVITEGDKPHILLVEDNADIRQYLQKSLAQDYSVSEAEDGHEGLQKTLDTLPDLILCDISMPGMDGLELTRQLKTRIETSHIPIVLLTARTSVIFNIDGLEAGADDYVTKPFNLKLLQIRIRNLIESRHRLRQKYAHSLNQLDPKQDPVGVSELDDQFLNTAMAVIEQQIENPDFSVDDLAKKLLLNRKQVYRKIKALTDQTPNELIRAVRLKKAAQLLKTHRYTVAEVTYMVGFQDLKYFRERFREFFGVNPSELGTP